jgi:cellulose synthase/poly-beta-1,6-N-acetylglucosamine synthase-like glycosyltransferase
MDAVGAILLVLHYGVLLLLGAYGCHRLYLITPALRYRGKPAAIAGFETLPTVTVQLPIYNEKFVVERLIDAAAALAYPRDRLQIQVLDDSTDETVALAAARVGHHRARGCRIEHIRRSDRTGYKAGALAHGLDQASGAFILILDADFVPEPDFLHKAIHPLADPAIGMVQARWSYLNRDRNALTRAQAVLLDAHFAIEQSARAARGVFFNFNGTAGIWRAKTIRDAGGWRAETLTEDLDLSYRAQMRGWRFAYLRDVTCPSELPVDINALKSQQYRWAKGAIEVLLALLPKLWATRLPLRVKLEASVHLTSNVSYLLLLIDSLFLLAPSIAFRDRFGLDGLLWFDLSLLALATISHVGFFFAGQRTVHAAARVKLRDIAVLIALLVGLTFNNARAVTDALLGRRSGFVRTPKLGANAAPGVRRSSWLGYAAQPSRYGAGAEIALGAAYTGLFVWLLSQDYWLGASFPALFAVGVLAVGAGSIATQRPALAPGAAR